ncbi:MAG: hypothetical protein WD971_01105 [Pirellulales bacterium]
MSQVDALPCPAEKSAANKSGSTGSGRQELGALRGSSDSGGTSWRRRERSPENFRAPPKVLRLRRRNIMKRDSCKGLETQTGNATGLPIIPLGPARDEKNRMFPPFRLTCCRAESQLFSDGKADIGYFRHVEVAYFTI